MLQYLYTQFIIVLITDSLVTDFYKLYFHLSKNVVHALKLKMVVHCSE